MITKPELQDLLQTTETYRVERTTSTNVPQDVPQDDTQSDTQGINHQSLTINHPSLSL